MALLVCYVAAFLAAAAAYWNLYYSELLQCHGMLASFLQCHGVSLAVALPFISFRVIAESDGMDY
ncbi:hypothetical protein COLO4_24553 [Corchorus olitorius]|uniref:Uncharacterized protein n=1 Tax=Corchorus olitorius TaxID=93759 RepID=A0A1R3I923_9ROSI|nr:hypothetical protein COLO4_24553 [Corchorus olitorius]